jgi:hypothetical protein
MNMRIALGTALLLALGSAVGSAAVKTHTDVVDTGATVRASSAAEVTPETLAMWKVTAATADYTPPRLPI